MRNGSQCNGSQCNQSNAHQENDPEVEAANNALTRGENLLAVFWYIDGKFYGPCNALNADEVELYGDYLDLPYDHFQIWPDCSPFIYDYEYDDFPRGRVMFDTRIHKFKVFTSEKLCNDKELKARVMREYGLPVTTIFIADEHYA